MYPLRNLCIEKIEKETTDKWVEYKSFTSTATFPSQKFQCMSKFYAENNTTFSWNLLYLSYSCDFEFVWNSDCDDVGRQVFYTRSMLIQFIFPPGRGLFPGKFTTTSGEGCCSTSCSKISVFEKGMLSSNILSDVTVCAKDFRYNHVLDSIMKIF